jgi:hypothetical protein
MKVEKPPIPDSCPLLFTSNRYLDSSDPTGEQSSNIQNYPY